MVAKTGTGVRKPAVSQQRHATIDDLLKKPARTREVQVKSVGDDGEEITLSLMFKSIGTRTYDDLITAHQPTKEQAKEGSSWNPDTFPPALIAACSSDPVISTDEAVALWESEDWSRGELMDLFFAVVKLNTEGLDIPFTENGSGTTTSLP